MYSMSFSNISTFWKRDEIEMRGYRRAHTLHYHYILVKQNLEFQGLSDSKQQQT